MVGSRTPGASKNVLPGAPHKLEAAYHLAKKYKKIDTRQHRRIFPGGASVLNASRAGSRPHDAWVHSS